jgi:hypothetical protein
MTVPEGKPVKAGIKDLEFPVLLFKQAFRNKGGTTGGVFWQWMS